MSKSLFISQDEDFNQRILQESKSSALVAPSLQLATQLVTDPAQELKAIYLNPKDTSFSALRFLELSLQHRPATPIFLIDSEGELSQASHQSFFEQHHIQGFFSDQESFEAFQASSFTDPVKSANLKRQTPSQNRHAGYLAVPILDFIHAKHYLFDVFLESDASKLSLFATAGSPVEPEYLTKAMEQAGWLYVNETNVAEIREKIRKTQMEMAASTSFPISWKTAETLYKAKVLLAELQSATLSDSMVNQTHELLGDVFHLVSQLQALQTSDKLAEFIEQAKECDRTIACATLSILMCKSLKFEKNAIVEILGLASLFQDVSLFKSPHGNLTEIEYRFMTPESQAYFAHHPSYSADLLAQNTSIPEVTLQVIRQHHERKDRTGFPGRIGGMQLHPMAEILSLINEFIDHNPQNLEAENEIYRHFSDRIVIAFKQIQFRVNPATTSLSNSLREAA